MTPAETRVPLPAKSLSDAHAIRQRAWETR